jgi:hypothetical protein
MKTCSVCGESYDGSESVEQGSPDICPACNRAFFTLDPDLDGESHYSSPYPGESSEQFAERVKANARELLVLEFCERVLSELVTSDADRAEYWRLKRKLAGHMLGFLRETVPTEYMDPQPALSAEEQQDILENHPLLQVSLPEAPHGVAVTEHLKKIRSRVRSYLKMREAGAGQSD